MLLADKQILDEVVIIPKEPSQKREGIISYGVTSYGYDFRLGTKFKIFKNTLCRLVDPKNFLEDCFDSVEGDSCIIPPNSFILGESVEYVEIPRNVLGICVGKSTYARCGLIVNVTPLESEWKGKITIEISNTTPLPAIVYANEGIMQVIFIRGEQECSISYKDKKGKYQNQEGIVLPRIDGT
jgi:dCTP deaminase